jgi:tetratricopeptide (TPR) repeat protein
MIRRRAASQTAIAALLLASAATPVHAQVVQNPFLPFDRARFEAAAKTLGATEAQLKAFEQQIEEFGLARASDLLLRAAVPAFAAAVQLQEANDPEAALALTKVLAKTEQPLLRAHLRYHLAEVFLASDDPERAMEVLNDYLRDDKNHSALDPEVAFYYAQALAEVPLPDLAIPRFRAFLQWFPDASERFRSRAHQRIHELERQQSDLHKLADEMKQTRRDLKKQKTDKPVQLDQEGYIEKLNELIEMFEEMERQAGGPPSGNGPSNAPATSSALPGGEATVGDLQKRPTLADRWGDMKDRDREKIEAQIQKDLPPQYRKMLEEYYKKLGSTPGTNR